MPPTITQAHPPMQICELVEGIRAFPTKSLEKKREFIAQLIGTHPLLNIEWGQNWRYRRVRILEPQNIPVNVTDVIWPPTTTTPGRMTSDGTQIFYLADRENTAFSEKNIEDDDIVLSEFEILPGKSIRVLPLGEMIQVQRTGRGFLSGDASSTINNQRSYERVWNR